MSLNRLKLYHINNDTGQSVVKEFFSYKELREYARTQKETFLEKIKKVIDPTHSEEDILDTTSSSSPQEPANKATTKSPKSTTKKFLTNQLRDEVQAKKKQRPALRLQSK